MANLFVVHTPLCFFVAQNIIQQEGLKNNILLIRNLEDSSGFDEGYKLLKLKNLWDKEYVVTDSRQWKKHPIRTSSIYIRNERTVMRIIRDNDVTAAYLGNVNDLRYRLELLRYKSMNINVSIYEEGLSHYVLQTYLSNKKIIFGSLLFDFLIRLPRINLSYLRYLKMSIPEFIASMITTRFNILPQAHGLPCDVSLRVVRNYSESLSQKVEETREWLQNVTPDDMKTVLYASQPLFGRGFIYDPVIRRVICDVLDSMKEYLSDKLVVIKYHPRETKSEQTIVEEIFRERGIRYCVMNTHRAIPLEVYLQSITFDRLIAFNSSCVAYSGYAYNFIPRRFYIQDYQRAIENEETLMNRENYILETKGVVEYFEFLNRKSERNND